MNTLAEFNARTNPFKADSDEDGLNDFQEVSTHGTDPLLIDSDSDGYDDFEEVSSMRSDPLSSLSYPGSDKTLSRSPISRLTQEEHLHLRMEIIINHRAGC